MRLFLLRFLIAPKQALTDPETGIAVGMIAHLALWAGDQRGAWSIAFNRLAGIVTHDQTMAAVTFPAGVARIHTTGDDPLVPRLIPGIPEKAALQPVGAFGVATARIPALFGLEIAQVLKHHDARSMRGCEPDNTSAHQVGHRLVTMADLGPEGGIVLLVFRDDASLRSVTCNASKRALPKARYLSAAPNEAGGQDGAFDGLDGANGNVLIDIEIDGADFCLHVSYLLCNLRWRGECLLVGGG